MKLVASEREKFQNAVLQRWALYPILPIRPLYSVRNLGPPLRLYSYNNRPLSPSGLILLKHLSPCLKLLTLRNGRTDRSIPGTEFPSLLLLNTETNVPLWDLSGNYQLANFGYLSGAVFETVVCSRNCNTRKNYEFYSVFVLLEMIRANTKSSLDLSTRRRAKVRILARAKTSSGD